MDPRVTQGISTFYAKYLKKYENHIDIDVIRFDSLNNFALGVKKADTRSASQ